MATLGIGTATFLPGYGPTATGRPGPGLLIEAVKAGIRYVDTAAAYGGAEAAIGQVADALLSADVRVATKVSRTAVTPEGVQASAGASLARLRMSRLDTVLAHSFDTDQLDLLSPTLVDLRTSGRVARVGASTYGVEDAVAAASSWCDTVQVEFSIVNQSVVTAIREQVRRRVEVVARSVLCKGLLTPSGAMLSVPDDVRDVLARLGHIASRLGMDQTALAIRFALDTPGIDVVLVGVSDEAELQAALSAWRRPSLTGAEYTEIANFDRSDTNWSHPELWQEGGPVT
jgi:aryl-alcohol dehydrogenase-like predicted oxidoreductase